MVIRFAMAMVFDVLYSDTEYKPVAVPHTFEGEYNVEQLTLEEERHGYTAFMVNGDQKDLIHGGIFEVPNPAFDVVKNRIVME